MYDYYKYNETNVIHTDSKKFNSHIKIENKKKGKERILPEKEEQIFQNNEPRKWKEYNPRLADGLLRVRIYSFRKVFRIKYRGLGAERYIYGCNKTNFEAKLDLFKAGYPISVSEMDAWSGMCLVLLPYLFDRAINLSVSP